MADQTEKTSENGQPDVDSNDATVNPPAEKRDPTTWAGLLLWSVLTLAVIGGGYFGFTWIKNNTGNAQAEATPAPPPLIRVATIEPVDVLAVSQTGFTRARATLSISAEVTGRVAEIGPSFRLGNRIAEGDLLFQIEQARFRADVESAEARIREAEVRRDQAVADLDRKRILLERQVSPEAVVEEAEAAAASARAALEVAKSDLSKFQIALRDTVVDAPFDAIVSSEAIALDQIVQPGQTLGELIAADYIEVPVGLVQRQITLITDAGEALGREVEISDAITDRKLATGRISSISPNVDAVSRTRNVVVRIPDPFAENGVPRVPINDLVRVTIPTLRDESDFIQLPAQSVKDGDTVWLVTEERMLKRLSVTVVRRDDDLAIIRSDDLSQGQSVMLTDLNAPFDGQEIRVEEPSDANSPSGDTTSAEMR